MFLHQAARRPMRSATALILFVVGLIYLVTPRRHVLQADLFQGLLRTSGRSLSLDEKSALCRSHGFRRYQNNGQRRKVYDLFLFSYELEWLDIRLHTLSPYVDYFVIVEATSTFTALPKPLILKDHWSNFTDFSSKMLYSAVDDEVISGWTWDHEDFIRNSLLYETFPHMTPEQQASNGDVLVVSDIDEIPKPETMLVLRHCDIPARVTLWSHFFSYSYQWLLRGEQWAHPQATVYRGLQDTVSPTNLRNGDEGPGYLLLRPLMRWWEKTDIYNAGWHCSNCFSSIKAIQTKLSSFSHTPWDTEANRDPATIVDKARNGKDLFGRPEMVYDRVEGNQDAPHYVLGNPSKFRHLLDRTGSDGAFVDYEPPS